MYYVLMLKYMINNFYVSCEFNCFVIIYFRILCSIKMQILKANHNKDHLNTLFSLSTKMEVKSEVHHNKPRCVLKFNLIHEHLIFISFSYIGKHLSTSKFPSNSPFDISVPCWVVSFGHNG